MKIQIQKEDLIEAIQTVENIIPLKSTLPILSNILFSAENNSLKLVSTDLEIGISKTVPADVSEKGSITLPAKRISSIVKELPEKDIEISVKKNNLTVIRSGNCVLKIIGIDSEEFPSLPKIEEGKKIEMDSSVLKDMLKMTSFAVSKDETRYVLNGLLFFIQSQKITIVATDGRRLALINNSINTDKNYTVKVIIPYKTIQIIEKMLEKGEKIGINIAENQILFSIEDTLIISRLIEGDFPDYQQVIPKESGSSFSVSRDVFLNSLKRANILTTVDSLGIRMDIDQENMVISKNTPEIGEIKEKISGSYDGKDISIGFNPNYLLDFLRNFKEDTVNMQLLGPEKPSVVKVEDRYIYLVLPMQLS